MNTKFFFLLLVSLLIATYTSSVSFSKSELSVTTESQTSGGHQENNGEPVDFHQTKWATDNLKTGHEEKSHLQPEDGKHHDFHFGRLNRLKRRKQLGCFACKIVLVFAHICCFLYCFFHVFH